MSDIKEANSDFKLSRVDLEVEKLKLQADRQAQSSKDIVATTEVEEHELELWGPLSGGNEEYLIQKFGYNPEKDNLDTFIQENNIDIKLFDDYYDGMNVILNVSSDELKLKLADEYWRGEEMDSRAATVLFRSLKSDNLKLKSIEKLKKMIANDNCGEISERYDSDFDYDNFSEEYRKDNRCSFEEYSKIITEQYIAEVIATLHNPEVMLQYYNETTNFEAKETILNGIHSLPEYKGELSTEELQEVSARMKEEVSKAEALNAQTRAGLEEEIMAALKSLTKAKQEYARLTKETSKEDSFDLE